MPEEDAMQRGYALCNMDLTKVISIDKNKQKFIWIDISGTKAINKALCFYDKTEARNIQQRIIDHYKGLMEESQVVNVSKLYSKVF